MLRDLWWSFATEGGSLKGCSSNSRAPKGESVPDVTFLIECCSSSCRSSEYAAAKESFDQKYKRQQAVLRPLQPSVLIESLSKAAAKADEESDALYDRFSSGEVAVDGFVAQYVRARTLYHQRELKCQAAQQTL